MFVINDESVVNSHNFRLINAGIILDRFKANPVLFYDHDGRNVIGRCNDLHIAGSQLLCDVEFDEKDADAMSIKGKVDRGFLKGCSPGIMVLDAQWVPTADGNSELQVVKSELCEVSITPIPSNSKAIRLYNKEMQELSADDLTKLAINKNEKQKTIKIDNMKLNKETLTVLGFEADPSDKELNEAILKLADERAELSTAIEKAKDEKAEEILALAIANGVVDGNTKEDFKQLALSNPTFALKLAGNKKEEQKKEGKQEAPRVSLAALVKQVPKSEDNRENWDYLRWAKEDPKGLAKMSLEDSEMFKKLKAGYGAE